MSSIFAVAAASTLSSLVSSGSALTWLVAGVGWAGPFLLAVAPPPPLDFPPRIEGL